jgi:murein DD-endopeptidase MepM/ murein hydrolase activator NlpD
MIDNTETLTLNAADRPRTPWWKRGQWLLARSVAWGATTSWHITADWRVVRPALMRYTAHLVILLLAVIALFVAGVKLPQAAAVIERPFTRLETDRSSDSVSISQNRSSAKTSAANPVFSQPDDDTITHLALPQTTIPERTRAEVLTYTVESGDTIFGIAEKYGLTPYTLYWANSETLEDNPHRLSVGMVLNILPVAAETVEGLADKYSVDPEALYNEWNSLERGQSLTAGMRLTIPGGKREFVVWQLPKTVASTGAGTVNQGRPGMCVGSYGGLPGRGWFDWPTAGRRVSGWYFRDPRNPAHNGTDFGLANGEPVYAADGGIIIFAGWWGASGYGNLIVVDHLNGWQTWYAHLSQVNVVCGQQVNAGEVIGLGGSTGRSSGPHLHFETRLEGVPYDPLAYLP